MILDTIANAARLRVDSAKRKCPLSIMQKNASTLPKGEFPFEHALKKPGVSFICEVKKASPSKGIIASDFPYLEIARDYQAAGAAAISVLTEPDYFMGCDRYLAEIAQTVEIPILRKDFTVDEYQIYEAKVIGASAVLLICSLLDTKTLASYLTICDTLGLSALVEVHTQEEVLSAKEAGSRIIGVNNRNLQTFEVDISNSVRLRSLVPRDILFVAESGIENAGHIHTLDEAGVSGVLIGEALMRSPDKKKELDHLKKGCLNYD